MRFRWIAAIIGLIILDALLLTAWRKWQATRRFDPLIRSAARRYDVQPAVVKAVVWRESRFNPKARGKAGEFGLMQIRLPAAQEWAQAEGIRNFSAEQLLDPETNTRAGSWYLGKLLKRYQHTDNPMAYALADYNAGRTHVLRWMKDAGATNSEVFVRQIDYPGTQRYIKAVLEQSRRYERRF